MMIYANYYQLTDGETSIRYGPAVRNGGWKCKILWDARHLQYNLYLTQPLLGASTIRQCQRGSPIVFGFFCLCRHGGSC